MHALVIIKQNHMWIQSPPILSDEIKLGYIYIKLNQGYTPIATDILSGYAI